MTRDETSLETPTAVALGVVALLMLEAAGFWRGEHTTVICAVFASGAAYLSLLGSGFRANGVGRTWARPLHLGALVAAVVLWLVGAFELL